jgi:hypothetical protein
LGNNSWPLRPEEHKSLNLFEEPILKDIASKHGKSIG